jgi:hypothetical protein
LQSLLAAEDLAEALQARPEWLDIELLTLVQANVQTAREQGELELAEGLETLADYVRDHLAGVPSERSAA